VPDKLRALIQRMNQAGIPIPVARDPATGKGSVTFTLVAVSAGIVAIGLLNSFAKVFKGVDMVNALYWNGMCLAAYLGRRMNGDGKKIEIEGKKEE
jgi:hypothetical protein